MVTRVPPPDARPRGRRVVVTGVGLLCAAGSCREEFWSSLRACRSSIGPLEPEDGEELPSMPAAQVRGFLPASHFDVPRLSYLDRSTQLLLVAAREAALQGATAPSLLPAPEGDRTLTCR